MIQELLALLQEDPLILASPEEALYFRMFAKTRQKPPPLLSPPPLPPKKVEPLPVVVKDLPAEVKIEEAKVIVSSSLDFGLLKKLFETIGPYLEEIPSDAMAKQLSQRWKTHNLATKISVLYHSESPKHKELLTQITKAIDIYFGPARLLSAEAIEKENQWDSFLSSETLRCVIVCDYTLWQMSHLMTYYKEVPTGQTRLLGKVPLFLLPDLSLYLKDPLLKRSLWKALCTKLSS